MSFQAAGWAIEQQVVTDPTARHVLLVLASYADKQGRSAFPAIESLMEDTGLKRRTIFAKLELLEQLNLIARGDQSIVAAYIKRADRRPVCWDLRMPPMFEKRGASDAPRVEHGPIKAKRGARNAPRELSTGDALPGAPDAPREATGCISLHDGVHITAERGAFDDTTGCTTCTRSVSKHPLISEGKVSDDETEKTAHTPNIETENPETPISGFDRFWAAWPSASGRKQASAVCRSHWDANGLDAKKHVIVAHVEAMKLTQHWKTGGDPTPIKYLEQRRWEDSAPGEIVAAAADDGTPWYESVIPEVIEAKGAALSVRPRFPDEAIASYRVLVVNASKEKSAVDFVLRDAKRFNDQRLYDFAVRTFGDALLPTDFYA